ncbi:hypothetical protein [Iodidimonas sp. SYSU 1G8]|uniref:hypothetical protein n=1 Tax=Iodidimonas sp. SYSU 1G8 TaxID=3133967 RepID=UPI0031FF3AAF
MTVETALREVNYAVLDLQAADYNTFERPLKRLALALNADDLKIITDDLKSKVDFDKFLENSSPGGGMAGSARLNWPSVREEEFGITIHLIERAANNPEWFLDLAFRYFYSGSKLLGNLRKIVSSVIIPFNRDFLAYVNEILPPPPQENPSTSPTVAYNINNMYNSPIQNIAPGGHGVQATFYSYDELESIVALYKRHVDELGLDKAQRRRADAQVATIEAQLIDEPDPTIIRAAGKSLKTIIEGAIGGAAGNAIAAAPIWTPLFSMFS